MSTSVRVAVVTGSNKGIGLAIVRSLCKKFTGDVYLTARDEGRGLEAVALLNAEGLGPKFHQLDITSQDSVDALKKFIADKYGGIDVLVNNAGILHNLLLLVWFSYLQAIYIFNFIVNSALFTNLSCKQSLSLTHTHTLSLLGVAFKHSSTASDIEQATVMCSIDFTGTQNMLRTFTPLLKPHGRIVTVAAWNGHLSRLQCADLRNRFSSPSLTEAELVSLVEEFISDVRAGKHKGKWCNTFYSSTKVAEIALTKVYAREIAKSGISNYGIAQ